tara:strand:- start:77 stop:304 length:228 start_codon:yes stop_codon:yes gene_type:complete
VDQVVLAHQDNLLLVELVILLQHVLLKEIMAVKVEVKTLIRVVEAVVEQLLLEVISQEVVKLAVQVHLMLFQEVL